MTKTEVIASVAGDLDAAEMSVDAAIARATTLVQAMIGARSALDLSPVACTGSQAKALEAISSLAAARQAMIECHRELAKDHRRLGYGVYAEGWRPKGEGETAPTQGRALRAV